MDWGKGDAKMEEGLGREGKWKAPKIKVIPFALLFSQLRYTENHLSEVAPWDCAPGDLAELGHNVAKGMNLSQVVFQGLFLLCGYDSYGKLG